MLNGIEKKYLFFFLNKTFINNLSLALQIQYYGVLGQSSTQTLSSNRDKACLAIQ